MLKKKLTFVFFLLRLMIGIILGLIMFKINLISITRGVDASI